MTRRFVSSSRVRAVLLLLGVLVLATSCGWSFWDSPMTTVRPRSDFGRWIDDIFMLISWTTLVIFVAVEGGLLYCCWRDRKDDAPVRQGHVQPRLCRRRACCNGRRREYGLQSSNVRCNINGLTARWIMH